MPRTGKRFGYHSHHSLQFGMYPEGPELTIMLVNAPIETQPGVPGLRS
ncbi:hypothetical protein SAMN05444167_2646 [Terriglobus roseus]|uniref:Uncharacterized protein n=1 Tax=Terriglobus roseus TaxID=392734 RepID=A0A1G7LZ65_9BACT|nr:hypothetical protein SAMN05444167_2646 [Terriglobus roseus]